MLTQFNRLDQEQITSDAFAITQHKSQMCNISLLSGYLDYSLIRRITLL